jgi:hypothetical protein
LLLLLLLLLLSRVSWICSGRWPLAIPTAYLTVTRQCCCCCCCCCVYHIPLSAVATLAIPTAIFDQDVRPKKGGIPAQGVSLRGRGDVAKASYDGSLPLTVNACLCHSMTGLTVTGGSGGSAPDISESDVAGAVAE